DQRICGFSGGPLFSYRINGEVVGPFDTVADFHAQPFCAVGPTEYASATAHIQRLISDRPNRPYEIHLVHGDLLLHNIMADEDLRPTGLIDWECAAWAPEYWERASSSRVHYNFMWCWKDILDKAFPKHEDDMAL
ncbi:hypothetical protein B0H13DRAFT_1529976, partial [Mycena leptocephala]